MMNLRKDLINSTDQSLFIISSDDSEVEYIFAIAHSTILFENPLIIHSIFRCQKGECDVVKGYKGVPMEDERTGEMRENNECFNE